MQVIILHLEVFLLLLESFNDAGLFQVQIAPAEINVHCAIFSADGGVRSSIKVDLQQGHQLLDTRWGQDGGARHQLGGRMQPERPCFQQPWAD